MSDLNRGILTIRRAATAIGAALLLAVAAAPGGASATAELSPAEQSQAGALSSQLLAIANGLPPGSSVASFEGAFAGALGGYSAAVVEAALAALAGTPGLPANAKLAASELETSYAENGGPPGSHAEGGFGSSPSSDDGPGFSGGGGGGGSNYGK
jgi:hypothetical protein